MASGWSDCCLDGREVNASYSSIALRTALFEAPLRKSGSLFQARLSGVVTQKNGSRAHHTAKPRRDERDLARQTAGVEMAA